MVSGDVAEDGDPAVWLGAWFGEEDHPGGLHVLVAGVEVVDVQEEPDPTGVLVAERCHLVFAVSAGEKDARLRAWRADDHPPLERPSLVRDGESSANSNPSDRVKKAIASS